MSEMPSVVLDPETARLDIVQFSWEVGGSQWARAESQTWVGMQSFLERLLRLVESDPNTIYVLWLGANARAGSYRSALGIPDALRWYPIVVAYADEPPKLIRLESRITVLGPRELATRGEVYPYGEVLVRSY